MYVLGIRIARLFVRELRDFARFESLESRIFILLNVSKFDPRLCEIILKKKLKK